MPNYDEAFRGREATYTAWVELNGTIKAAMDLRRYELVTLAAAKALRSTYCCVAHGRILAERFGEPVREIVLDHRAAALDPVDVAVMNLAERVVDDATSITEADRQELRDLGLSDADVMDVVHAAAARSFFSKTLDALGMLADEEYLELDPATRIALTVGRPIAGSTDATVR